jgi:hypothetical protein
MALLFQIFQQETRFALTAKDGVQAVSEPRSLANSGESMAAPAFAQAPARLAFTSAINASP